MSSENSKIRDPHRLLLNPMDKTNLKSSDKYIVYQILVFVIQSKIWTKSFKIKTRYFLQLLTPGTIKLLGSTKIAKDDNGKNVSHSEIT